MVTLTKQPTDVFIRPSDADVIRTEVVTLMDEIIAGVDAAPLRPVATSASNVTVVAGDIGKLFVQTGASTINLVAAATAGNGFTIYVQANGGAVTIDPNGSEQINGAPTLALADGEAAIVTCTGTAWRAIVVTSLASLGSAASEDVGTAIGDVVQLVNVGGVPGLPAVSGASLTNLPSAIGGAANTPTRAANTSYQNTNGKPIVVGVDVESSSVAAIFFEISANNSTWFKLAGREVMDNGASLVVGGVVPASWYWRVSVSTGTATVNATVEVY